MKYQGSERYKNCSPLGKKVADILGQAWVEIYHLDEAKLDFTNERCIEFKLASCELATWDFGLLTALVVLCHDAAVRMSIKPMSRTSIQLLFHQRSRTGDLYQRHPTMEEHVKQIRDRIGLGVVDDEAGEEG